MLKQLFQTIASMHIELQPDPYHSLTYLNAGTKRAGYRYDTLNFLQGRIAGLPSGPPALVAMADLQGRSDFGDADETLLGVAIADEIEDIQKSAGLPDPFECPVFLAGDFYTVPNAAKRGGTGNVRLVWQFMTEVFQTVTGVAGNHDTFGDSMRDGAAARAPKGCLDGNVIDVGSWRVGGISGSIGHPKTFLSLQKKAGGDYARLLKSVLLAKPDMLILHVPPFVDEQHVGSQMITDCLVASRFSGLVLCGHCPWPERVQTVGRATILNVHEAVITLTI